MSRGLRLIVLGAPVLAAAIVVGLHAAIPQPLSYHRFADQRTLFGVPHGLDVLSNLPFAFVGLYRMHVACRIDTRSEHSGRWAYIIFFVGVFLTFFGSGYYHLAPDNDRLVWDRLPMTLGFMGLLAANVTERLNSRAGVLLLPPLVFLGLLTVVYWHATEAVGHGDLRPYLAVQFGSLLAVVLLIALFPPRHTHSYLLVLALLLYVAAKVLESFDSEVFRELGFVSGHSLKHLVSALAVGAIALMLVRREPPERIKNRQAVALGA